MLASTRLMKAALATPGLSAAIGTTPARMALNPPKSTPMTTVNEWMGNGPVTLGNYVDGKAVAPAKGEYMDVVSPHDGAVIAKCPVSTQEDVDAAVASAKAAFPEWSKTNIKERVQYLYRFHNLLEENYNEMADIIIAEHGKNRAESIGSLAKGNETVEWAASMPQLIAGKILQVSTGVTCAEFRDPVGVVTSILPFNFPAMVGLWTVPMALATGNTMVLKPSEKVPMSWTYMMNLWEQVGLPDGVLNIVHGTKDTVENLIDHPDTDIVTFVGSTPVARDVYKRSINLNKKCVALGGAKNHLVALPDCNLEMTASDIVNSFTGCAGQRCMAASVLVVVGDQPELINKIQAHASKLVPGKEGGCVGPVIDPPSQERILRYVNEAEANGSELLVDGRGLQSSDGTWVGPTVIMHKSAQDAAVREEIFGPVLSIVNVKTMEEAIAIENSNEYGNAACVYTTVGEHADWFTSRFRAGMIGVNIGVPVPREPFSFGGLYWSKFGHMDLTGDGGMELFTQRRKVTTKWTPPSQRTWMD